ncbi:type IV pilus twitching motility protein PilT [Demequina zhanjiangensis]|uniref:Type IV pilus twitching motility protein PilT n=1 Tax=Demequina zhanjiangensis TaxID=3051659 RepID=A0ABT8G118_9MICO|nr:type IV pilus twitching motility protein PilT [Demequina sp. SYSU T00b26]MDN4472788.1 type IV pilus twitching motility protein PilT [Demequina sp. SYSU T00b26]
MPENIPGQGQPTPATPPAQQSSGQPTFAPQQQSFNPNPAAAPQQPAAPAALQQPSAQTAPPAFGAQQSFAPAPPAPAPQSAPTVAPPAAPAAPAVQRQPLMSQGQPPAAPQQPSAAQPAQQAAPPARPAAPAPATTHRVGMSQERQEGDLDISQALRGMLASKASDLHLTTGAPPMVRVDGGLRPLEGFGPLTKEGLQRTLYQILTQAQRERFEEELELDFSYALVGEARFRVNMYQQRESVGAAFRVIPYEIKPLEALGIPAAVKSFADLPRGLVLVTGPTGSGKSTTLASLLDLVNRSRSGHIMTVEDPIEFLHRHKRSLVNQREVGTDTHSFQKALKHVLRQDPDVILIGEMRDLETIQVALTAAETGHLVFATLHTQDAAQTIDRVIDVFPAEQQGQVRTQLATAIQGVLCQALLPRADGPGRAVAVEVMLATPAIRNLIREGKTHQIHTSLQAGASMGMQTMDQHLAELVKEGAIHYDYAVEIAHSVEEFNRLAGRANAQR